MRTVYKFLLENIRSVEQLEFFAKPGAAFATLILLVTLAWLGHFLTRQIILRIVNRIALRSKTSWDDILVNRNVFRNLAHLVPAFILYHSADFSYPIIHQELTELSDATISMLAKDYYFSMAGFLTKTAQIYFV
jgi:miniconductance mechanosensitive channel